MPAWDPTRWRQTGENSYILRRGEQGAPDLEGGAQNSRFRSYDEFPAGRSAQPVYASMTRARLIAECERRGLKTYGSKKTLAERLEKNDGRST